MTGYPGRERSAGDRRDLDRAEGCHIGGPDIDAAGLEAILHMAAGTGNGGEADGKGAVHQWGGHRGEGGIVRREIPDESERPVGGGQRVGGNVAGESDGLPGEAAGLFHIHVGSHDLIAGSAGSATADIPIRGAISDRVGTQREGGPGEARAEIRHFPSAAGAVGTPVGGQIPDMHVAEPGFRRVHGDVAPCRDDCGGRVNADVIHGHALRKCGAAIRIARPVSTHRDVENQELRLVENPSTTGRQVGRGECEKDLPVEEPADTVFLPLDGIHVEVISQCGT